MSDPQAVINESYRLLGDGGWFGVDDWFLTDSATEEQHEAVRYNWSTSAQGFHNISTFTRQIETAGFQIADTVDYTEEAGAFLSEDRFGATYDEQIAPVLRTAFPRLYQYPGYEPAHADMAVEQLRSNILYMGELYRNGDAVYRQIIAQK